MKEVKTKPEYASEVPFVPVNWEDRDNITGRLLQIMEAVMPAGKQLEATKDLVKDATKRYWIDLFNDQYDFLTRPGNYESVRMSYWDAIWERALKDMPTEDLQV